MKRFLLLISILLFISATVTFGVDGFGKNTTGGDGGEIITVTDAAAFKKYVETINTPYIVQVRGTISLEAVGGFVDMRSNKTVRGIGKNQTIIGELEFKNGSSNAIIEKLNITNPQDWGEGDGLSIKEHVKNVFITKCTFYDCDDGCLDITRGSDWITVSWCKFYFTKLNTQKNRVSLIGNSDNAADDDEGKLHVSMHHNWFGSRCWQRIPSVRFAKVHLYNNYYDCADNLYCVRSRVKAECLIENNIFIRVRDPYLVYVKKEAPEDKGKISAKGNVIEDCKGQPDAGHDKVFTPSYSYKLDKTDVLKKIVQSRAGANGISVPVKSKQNKDQLKAKSAK